MMKLRYGMGVVCTPIGLMAVLVSEFQGSVSFQLTLSWWFGLAEFGDLISLKRVNGKPS